MHKKPYNYFQNRKEIQERAAFNELYDKVLNRAVQKSFNSIAVALNKVFKQ